MPVLVSLRHLACNSSVSKCFPISSAQSDNKSRQKQDREPTSENVELELTVMLAWVALMTEVLPRFDFLFWTTICSTNHSIVRPCITNWLVSNFHFEKFAWFQSRLDSIFYLGAYALQGHATEACCIPTHCLFNWWTKYITFAYSNFLCRKTRESRKYNFIIVTSN